MIFLNVPPLSISRLFLEKIFLQLQNFCRIFAKFCRKGTALFLPCPQLLRWWWKWCWHEFWLDSLLAAGHWSALRGWSFSPLGVIGHWVPLSLNLFEKKWNKITLQIRQWLFLFWKQPDQSMALTAKILLSQDLCFPGVVITLFELWEMKPWAGKTFTGNLHRPRN